MKKQFLLPGLLLVLALSLTACRQTEMPLPTPTTAPTPTAAPTPTLPPAPTPTSTGVTPVWGEQTFARTFSAGDSNLVMQVTYTLPLAQNADVSPAGKAISAWYKQEGAARLAAAEENYELVVADYDVSAASGLPFYPTVEEMTFEVMTSTPCISVRREYSVSSGGASTMVFRLSEQFDTETGAQLHFGDFFSNPDGTLEEINAAFLSQVDIAQAVSSGALTADQVLAAFQPENFYLTEAGYVFWIQAGDLPATHSYIEVTLPYHT